MKTINNKTTATLLLVTGLLFVISPSIIGRFTDMPDMAKGLLNGIGLAIEFLGVVGLDRNSKKNCMIKN